jgi:hypothetical protein
MRIVDTTIAVALTIACCLTLGCGDGRPQRVPVSGQVLIDGKPLTTGGVRFTPLSGRPSSGSIDSEGRFSLMTYEAGDGCTLGAHRISVVAVEQVNSSTRRWNAPKSYASPQTSGLAQTIEGPVDSLKIELTWGNQKGPIVENIYGE